MPSDRLPEGRESLRRSARQLAEAEIAPLASRIDDEDANAGDLIRLMSRGRLGGVFVPERYGGMGLGHTERVIILEEISRHSPGCAMALAVQHIAMAAILQFGTEAQKQEYLPSMCSGETIGGLAATEPSGGSDFMGQKATAEFADGEWVINAHKCFISNSDSADLVIVTARTGTNAKGRPEITAFLVPRGVEGFGSGPRQGKLGLRGSEMGNLVFKNARVGEDTVIGGVGGGARLALSIIGEVGRSGMAAISLGILRSCLEDSVQFAKKRIIYDKPLVELANIRSAIAETRTDYEAARLLLHNAVTLKDRGMPCSTEVSIAKFFAAEAGVRAAKRTIDLMGAYGLLSGCSMGRRLQDAMTMISTGGTSHIQKMVIAAGVLANSGP